MLKDNAKCSNCDYTTYLIKGAVNYKVVECPRCGVGFLKPYLSGSGAVSTKSSEVNDNPNSIKKNDVTKE